MAVGDVVNGILAQTANYSTFQPAAGVEVMITSTMTVAGAAFQLYDGTNFGSTVLDATASQNCKNAITNTNYARFYSTDPHFCFTGIQIK